MPFLAIMATMLIGAFLMLVLILSHYPRPNNPFFIQIDDDLDNIEWLVLMIIRNLPHKKIYLIDNSPGHYRKIIMALARRYHLIILNTCPADCQPFYLKAESKAYDLLKHCQDQENGQKSRSY